MSNEVTLKIILDTRRPKQSGLYPLKLRVTFQRKQKYYPILTDKSKGLEIPFDLHSDDFDKIFGAKPREEYKKQRTYLDEIMAKALTAVKSIPFFTFEQFEAKYFGEQVTNVKSANLDEAFDQKKQELLNQGLISSYRGYKMSQKSISGFKKNLKFYDITPDFLRSYKNQMEQEGKSAATIGIYLRYLRVLFNEAIEAKIISREAYPFGKNRFSIPTKGNPAEPLKQPEIEKIFKYTPINEAEAKARDLWIFSFLLNGANMKDVSLLKFRNVDFYAESITFYRSKTSNTAKEPKAIQVTLTPFLRAIIERWGNLPNNPDNYIFPIFEKGMTPQQQYKANENIRKTIRKYMGRIAENLGILKTKIHNYTARDSYAAAQRNAGESGDAIGEALGHENRSTTDAYLDRFGEDTQRRMANNAMRYLGNEDNLPTDND